LFGIKSYQWDIEWGNIEGEFDEDFEGLALVKKDSDKISEWY